MESAPGRRIRLRRWFLYAFLGILALFGIFGVVLLVAITTAWSPDDTGPFIGVGLWVLVMCLAAIDSLGHPFWEWVGVSGMAALAGGVTLIAFMLIEESRFPAAYSWPMLWASIGVSMTTGSALSLVSFVLTRGTGRLDRVVRRITAVGIGVSACVFVAFICDEEAIGRGFIAFPISLLLTGAGFLASGAFGGLAEIRNREIRAAKCDLWIRCPRCSKEQNLAAGESCCSGCRMMFHIEVEEPICPKCGYNVHMLTRPICPECGEQLSPQLAPTAECTPTAPVAASAS